MKFFICQINPIVGDIEGNTQKIIQHIKEGKQKRADVVIFPEMALCGYPADDLLFFDDFIISMEIALDQIAEYTEDITTIVGLVRKSTNEYGKRLFNTAAIIKNKKLLGFKDKTLLPTYDVFNEARYFASADKQKVWEIDKYKVGVLICEDVWSYSGLSPDAKYKVDPVKEMKTLSPDYLVVISSSPYYFEKINLRDQIYAKAASYLNCPIIACNQVGANDQLVFDGRSAYYNVKGEKVAVAKAFEEDDLFIDSNKLQEVCSIEEDPMENLYKALVLGIKDYFGKQKLTKAILGLSGGIDSAIALYLTVQALGKENVLVLNMPSRFSSLGSIEDSKKLCENLQVEMKEISIDQLFQNFLDVLSPYFLGKSFDTAEENLQARIRGMILMAMSNKFGYIVISTGNKSEMAMGYATLYGDMCGGLGVLVDVPKTLVYDLARWINKKNEIIPQNILTKAPSAELKEGQTDQDSLPEYNIVDKVLHGYIQNHSSKQQIAKTYHLSEKLVDDLIHKVHLAEYKRRQAPPCIRVTKTSFGRGRYFPIVQGWVK